MEVNVYKADLSHVEIWLKLAKEFYAEGFDEWQWGFNDDHARATYTLFIQNHLCYIAELNGEAVGCLAGVITQHHFNYHHLYFQESMWYIKSEHRSKGIASELLRYVTQECYDRKCNNIIVGHTANVMPEHMKRFYQQLGFKLFETHYIKDL